MILNYFSITTIIVIPIIMGLVFLKPQYKEGGVKIKYRFHHSIMDSIIIMLFIGHLMVNILSDMRKWDLLGKRTIMAYGWKAVIVWVIGLLLWTMITFYYSMMMMTLAMEYMCSRFYKKEERLHKNKKEARRNEPQIKKSKPRKTELANYVIGNGETSAKPPSSS